MVVRLANKSIWISRVYCSGTSKTRRWIPSPARLRYSSKQYCLGVVLAINLLFVGLFRRELQITSFDPQLAKSLGISPMIMHYSLASLVALTSVSSFESVGNILVVSMFIVPPATAWLLTKRMSSMVLLSGLLAAISAIVGHWLAVAGRLGSDLEVPVRRR